MNVKGGTFMNNYAEEEGCLAYVESGSFNLIGQNVTLDSVDSQCTKAFIVNKTNSPTEEEESKPKAGRIKTI